MHAKAVDKNHPTVIKLQAANFVIADSRKMAFTSVMRRTEKPDGYVLDNLRRTQSELKNVLLLPHFTSSTCINTNDYEVGRA